MSLTHSQNTRVSDMIPTNTNMKNMYQRESYRINFKKT